jgi:hypothetical protein
MKTLDHMGFYYHKKKLSWTAHGFWWWMPEFIKRAMIIIWNKIACCVFGHDWIVDGDPKNGGVWKNKELVDYKFEVCCDCCKSRKRR